MIRNTTMTSSRTAGSKKPRITRSGPGAAGRRSGKGGWFSGFARGVAGIIWILLGLLLTGVGIGTWYGSRMLVDIIEEINQRDFSSLKNRETVYEDFFDSRAEQGFIVERDENRNFQGVISYMWRVKPPMSLDTREFEWDSILQDATVVPATNGAAMLDVKLGFLTEAAVRELELTSGPYNPEDPVDRAIVYGDLGLRPVADNGDEPVSWEVLPPLVSPSQGMQREGASLAGDEDPEQPDEDPGGDTSGSGSGSDAIDVIPD